MLPFLLTLYGYAQHVLIILLWWIIVAFIIIVWAYMILDFCKPCITRHHEIETIILLHTSYHFIILLGSIIQNVAYKNIFLFGLVLVVCSRTTFFLHHTKTKFCLRKFEVTKQGVFYHRNGNMGRHTIFWRFPIEFMTVCNVTFLAH